jgi:hypothetical protein
MFWSLRAPPIVATIATNAGNFLGGGRVERTTFCVAAHATFEPSRTLAKEAIAGWPRRRTDESSLIARAAERGVGIYGMSHYFLTRERRTGFLLGYSRMNIREIREGIRRLRGLL